MMLRIAIMVLTVAVVGFLAWRRFRPNPLLVVALRYRRLARSHPNLARAIKMRGAMVKLALSSEAADAHPLALDVDALIESIAAMCEAQVSVRSQAVHFDANSERARQLRNEVADLDNVVRDALDQLHELHMHLVKVTGAEIDAAIEEIRQGLASRQRDLAFVLEAHREVDAMLDKADGDA